MAIAESSPAREGASERFKICHPSDYRELLKQVDIDAVTVADYAGIFTRRWRSRPLKARKHVMLEKPVATTAKEASKIINTASKNAADSVVGRISRFNRHTQMAKMK